MYSKLKRSEARDIRSELFGLALENCYFRQCERKRIENLNFQCQKPQEATKEKKKNVENGEQHIVSQNTEYKPIENVPLPAAFQLGNGDQQIYAHALAWPPTFGNDPRHYTAAAIVEYWQTHGATTEDYITFGQAVFNSMVDVSKPVPFAELQALNELSKTVVHNKCLYMYKFCVVEVDWTKIFLAARNISLILNNELTDIPLAKYARVVDVIAELGSYNRIMMIELLEKKTGSRITNLAAMSDIKNVKYMLSRLKISNAVPLLHAVFKSPTISGKITAIIRLLELYDFLYQDIGWSTIDKLAEYLFLAINWIMEKCEQVKDLSEAGVNWVKVKLEDFKNKFCSKKTGSSIGIESITKHSGKSFFEKCAKCDAPPHVGCSICYTHLCKTHRGSNKFICACPQNLKHIHFQEQCDCGNNQDCLWRAAAEQLKTDVVSVKRKVYTAVQREHIRQDYEMYPTIVPNVADVWTDYATFKEAVLNQLNVNVLAENESMIALGLVYKRSFVLNNLGEESDDLHVFHFQPQKEPFVIERNGTHFEYSEIDVSLIQPTFLLPGVPYPEGLIDNVMTEMEKKKKDGFVKRAYNVVLPVAKDDVDYHDELSECDTESLVSESSAMSGSLTDVSEGLKKYLNLADCVSRRTNSDTPSEYSADEIDHILDNAANNERQENIDLQKIAAQEQDFWELIKNFEFNEIGNRVGEWFKSTSKHLLTWFQRNPFFTGLMSIFIGIASFLGLNIVTFSGDVQALGVIKRFTEASRAMYYGERGLSSIVNAIGGTMEAAKDILGISENPELDDFKSHVAEMYEMANVMLSEASNNPGKFVNNGENFIDFQKKMIAIQKTYANLVKIKDSRGLAAIAPIWVGLNKVYEKLHYAFNKLVSSAQTRQEPVVVYLYGATNLGKSQLTNYIIDKLRVRLNQDLKTFTISKGPTFWNGFAQQAIARIDDMNAIIGPEGDVDSQVMFNIASSAAYNPNQAAIEDKNIMFNGRFLFICSNHKGLPENSIVAEHLAWERRRDFFIHVTWPEHERECGPTVRNCKHWEGKTIDDFSHLTLRLCAPETTVRCNPNASLSKILKPHYKKDYVTRQMTDEELDARGVPITVDQLVDAIIGKELENNRKYELAMRRSAAVTALFSNVEKQTAAWTTKPHAFIMGPPGTGKSYIVERFLERNNDMKVKKIMTREQFSEWAKSKFVSVEPCVVIVNDLSKHVDQPEFGDFIDAIHTRNDEAVLPSDRWIMCGNQGIFDCALLKKFQDPEACQMIYRRAELVTCDFKRKTTMFGMVYTREKYKVSDIVDPLKFCDYVEYTYKGQKLTQESVVTKLLLMKPELVQIVSKQKLSLRDRVKPTTILRIPKNHNEFIRMINDAQVMDIVRFVAGGSCTISTSTGKTIKELSTFIFDIIRKARNMEGTVFDTVDDVLLQAWNSDLLEPLKGECFLLHLQDKVYYIDYTTENLDVGLMYGRLETLRETIKELDMVVETISVSDLFKARGSFLPHWLILGGEILSTICSVALTTCSAIASVKDQQQMFDAQKFQLDIENLFTSGAENVKESAINRLTHAMSTGTNQKKFPGTQFPKNPQYSDISALESQKTFLDGCDQDKRSNITTTEVDPSGEPRGGVYKGYRKKIRESGGEFSGEERSATKFNARSKIRPEYTYQDFKKFKTGPVMESIDWHVSIDLREPNEQKKLEALRKEVATDPSLYPIIERMLQNCVEIVDLSGKRMCSGLCVRGRIVRTVEHILEHYNINQLRVRTFAGKTYRVEIVKTDPAYDRLDLRVIDPSFPVAKDITAHFPKMSNTITEGSTVLLVTPDTTAVPGHLTVYIRSYNLHNITYKNFENTASGMYVVEYRGIRVGYKSTGVQTKYGDCGSLLILADTNVSHGKVIGMHFAASEISAYASPLRAEHYEDKLTFQSAIEPYISTEFFNQVAVEEKPTLKAICKFRPHIPNKTKLFRNWIPIGEELYEPSILCSTDPRGDGQSMLFRESMRWCAPREVLPATLKDELEGAMEEFVARYVTILKREGVTLRKLTSTEALNKMRGASHSEPINIHTSAGFPWSTYTTKVGKTGYIVVGKDGERRFSNDPSNLSARSKLQTEMNKLENMHRGMKSEVIFQVYLKDELVKKKKIYEKPKTRTIAVIPLHALIVFRKYFHAAHVAMMEHWDKLGPKVGINPMSMDWHKFATNLLETSTMGIDLDFSGWDFSHPPFFFHLLYLFYSTLYSSLDPNCTENDNEVRWHLYQKIQNFLVLIGTELHQTTGGLPSGYPGTTPDNSILNEFMMYFAYKQIMKIQNPSCANITSFYEDVSLGTYGDDVILAISQWASKLYNGQTIATQLKPLGFNVQASDKGDTITPIRPILECTFLSRQFIYRNGIIIGPLNRPNLYKPSHFSSDRRSHHFYESPDEKIQAVDIVQNVYESLCYNAALDERRVFDEIYDVALKISKMTDGPLPPTYSDCISRMFGYTLPQFKVEGVTFIDMPEVLTMNVAVQIPKEFDVYRNRACIQYGVDYLFGGKVHKCNPIPKPMAKLLEHVNITLKRDYNSVLVNVYPPGGGIPWHKDSEVQLDRTQGVFGITLVGDGRLYFKNNHVIEKYYMEPGLGYLMNEYNLSNYQHMRTDHTMDTHTVTFRKLVPPDVSSPAQ